VGRTFAVLGRGSLRYLDRFCVERSSDQFQPHFRRDTPRRVAAEAMISERQYRTCMVLPKSDLDLLT